MGQCGCRSGADAGARKLSTEEWKEQVVQTVVIGRSASGGNSEITYTANGVVQGVETHPLFTGLPLGKVYGEWAVDDRGRVCMKNVRIGKVAIADRCQYWFTYGGRLFVAESDSNRGALALARTVKP